MTNFHVFNTSNQPIYDFATNTYQSPYTVSPPEGSAGRAGSLFSISGSASALVVLGLTAATVSLRLNNPVGSGKTAYISGITVSMGGSSLLSNVNGSANLYRGGTLSSPTTLTPLNRNFGSSNTSVLQAQSSTSAVSGGTTMSTFQLAPGAFFQTFSGSIIVPPGFAFCVNVTSSSSVIGLTIVSTASLSWWEA